MGQVLVLVRTDMRGSQCQFISQAVATGDCTSGYLPDAVLDASEYNHLTVFIVERYSNICPWVRTIISYHYCLHSAVTYSYQDRAVTSYKNKNCSHGLCSISHIGYS